MSPGLSARHQQYEMTPVTISTLDNSCAENQSNGESTTAEFSPSSSKACDPLLGKTPQSQQSEPMTVHTNQDFSEPPPDFDCSTINPTVESMDISSEFAQSPDIGVYNNDCSEDVVYRLITEREPDLAFKFPAKMYQDKRRTSGERKKYCQRDWFRKFNFIAYSRQRHEIYCLARRLFLNSSHRRPKNLITEPYRNWKDALVDLKLHSVAEHHVVSMN